jgi:ribosomal protein S17E
MSTVTPSEGYNSYNMRKLSDMEEELRRDAKRVEQNSAERTKDLEKSYRKAIDRVEERSNSVVEDIRNDASESTLRSRENDRAEVERTKQQFYDKNGRLRSAESEALRERLQQTASSAEVQHLDDERRYKEADKNHAKQVSDINLEHRDKLEKTVARERDSVQSAFDKAYSDDRSGSTAVAAEARKKYDELNRTRMEEQADGRRATARVISDSQRDIENQRFHQDRATEERVAKTETAAVKHIEDAARHFRENNVSENRRLREQVSDLIAAEGTYMKEKGVGREEAVRELEGNWRSRERISQDSHERELAKFRDLIKASDDYNGHLNDRNMRERDSYYTGLLAKGTAENREEFKALTGRYETIQVAQTEQAKKDKELAQVALENSRKDTNEQRQEALDRQARTFQESMGNQRTMDGTKISALEAELRRKSNSADTNDISPAAENAVRRSVAKEYEKNFSAESERNKRTVASLQHSYSDRMQNAEAEHSRTATEREQGNQTERHQEMTRFMEHVADVEETKEQALRSKEGDHERQTDQMNRAFSQMNTRQRSDFEANLNAQREDSAAKFAALRQDAGFQIKMMQKTFSLKQNELIRDYEKKLSDQRIGYEEQIDELKSQKMQGTREGDRKLKNALDEQSRQYEQRLAQTEAQRTERERSISQNYQDELEKVKRANALLQSKRG